MKRRRSTPPVFEPIQYEVREINEGRKRWFEVHGAPDSHGVPSAIVVVNSESRAPWRFRTYGSAARVRDRRNKESLERHNRTERVIP